MPRAKRRATPAGKGSEVAFVAVSMGRVLIVGIITAYPSGTGAVKRASVAEVRESMSRRFAYRRSGIAGHTLNILGRHARMRSDKLVDFPPSRPDGFSFAQQHSMAEIGILFKNMGRLRPDSLPVAVLALSVARPGAV